MSKYNLIFLIFFSLISTANALVKEAELPIASYHLDSKNTFEDAPNKIDSNATTVLNPGILIGADTRENTKTEGFSFVAKGGFLQDCANKTAFLLGAGGRYRHFVSNKISMDLNGYLAGANAVKSFQKKENLCTTDVFGNQNCQTFGGDNSREFAFLPLINIGFNYHLESDKTIGFTVSYIPKNTAIAATSGSDLLFFTINTEF